jgi:hypothetical protein
MLSSYALSACAHTSAGQRSRRAVAQPLHPHVIARSRRASSYLQARESQKESEDESNERRAKTKNNKTKKYKEKQRKPKENKCEEDGYERRARRVK